MKAWAKAQLLRQEFKNNVIMMTLPIFLRHSGLLTFCFSLAASVGHAETNLSETYETCLLEQTTQADETESAGNIRAFCKNNTQESNIPDRVIQESITQKSEFVITPHRQNYILPYTFNASPNQAPWIASNTYPDIDDPIQNTEAKFQLSLKIPMTQSDTFFHRDQFYFGFTLKSFWQVYNSDISAPFRETNYRPEFYYQSPIQADWLANMGANMFLRGGIEHESNGRSQLLSRSWNRVFLGAGFIKDNWAFYLQPWYRLEEDLKEDDNDPTTPLPAKGDDNPDIQDYLGHYELDVVYKYGALQWTSLGRLNFETGKGAFEIGVSFPIHARIKGYVQYFDGYGDSLIDYNDRVQRLGIGVLLTDLL
jgi:phospholipase A1